MAQIMDNIMGFFMRSAAVFIFVLALSVTNMIVSGVKACTDSLEQVMEYDDVLHFGVKSAESSYD